MAQLDFKESLVELSFPTPDDLRHFEVTVKPDTGIWQGGRFKFSFEIPPYALLPPWRFVCCVCPRAAWVWKRG